MQIPIFPLNGAVLFPNTTLPLNIFEKRYLDMVEYALENKRYIGMIQTKTNGELFKIGCMGKIINFSETPDGRYLISLEGLNNFKIIKEIKQKYLFRIVEAEIINDTLSNKLHGDNFKSKILDKYKIYVDRNNLKLDIKELEEIPGEQLAKFIIMVSPFSDQEKQMCLESSNSNEFVERLLSVLEIYSNNVQENKTIN